MERKAEQDKQTMAMSLAVPPYRRVYGEHERSGPGQVTEVA